MEPLRSASTGCLEVVFYFFFVYVESLKITVSAIVQTLRLESLLSIRFLKSNLNWNMTYPGNIGAIFVPLVAELKCVIIHILAD